MFTASTHSSHMSIKPYFLNMLPGYAYGIDTFWLCVDEICFFKTCCLDVFTASACSSDMSIKCDFLNMMT